MMNKRHLTAFAFGLFAAGAYITATGAARAGDDAPGRAAGVQRERYAQAVQAFREHHYAAAYGRFAAAADGGHVPSAQLALAMHEHGRELFGSEWSASPDQRRRWHTLVINAARQRIERPDNDGGD